eukprot:2118475-Amphidinium_carterae.1
MIYWINYNHIMLALYDMQPSCSGVLHDAQLDPTTIVMAQQILDSLSKGQKRAGEARPASSGGDDLRAAVQAIARLSLAHEDQIQSLEGASTLQVAIFAPPLKEALQGVQRRYSELTGKQRSGAEAIPSLRAACHSVLMLELGKVMTAQTGDSVQLAATVTAFDEPTINKALCRFKPLNRCPDDASKAWYWTLVPSNLKEGQTLAAFWREIAASSPPKSAGSELIVVGVPPPRKGKLAKAVADILPEDGSKKRR